MATQATTPSMIRHITKLINIGAALTTSRYSSKSSNSNSYSNSSGNSNSNSNKSSGVIERAGCTYVP